MEGTRVAGDEVRRAFQPAIDEVFADNFWTTWSKQLADVSLQGRARADVQTETPRKRMESCSGI